VKAVLIGSTIIVSVFCVAAGAQTITVTNPNANTVWNVGSPATIQWTKQGSLPATVRILLIDEAEATIVQVIKDPAPNTGTYQWPAVQGSFTLPKYKVKVRASNTQIAGTSAAFLIKSPSPGGFQQQPGQAKKAAAVAGASVGMQAVPVAPIRVLSPAAGDTWDIGHLYTVKWTSTTSPDDAFDVDLYDSHDTKLRRMFSGAGTAQRGADGSWSVQANIDCQLPAGQFKVKVTSWGFQKTGASGLFNGVIKTKKLIESIPVHIENAHIIASNCCNLLSDSCTQQAPGDRARVGKDGGQNGSNYAWHVLRARLTVDLSKLANKKGDVESATLIIGDMTVCPPAYPNCLGSLFALNPNEVNMWNILYMTATHNLYPLAGWSSPINPATGVDITVPVRDWLKQTKPNLGFVVTAAGDEAMGCSPQEHGPGEASSCSYSCVMFFHPIMYVTFIQQLDPCNPQ
jgi:hypothetical protein